MADWLSLLALTGLVTKFTDNYTAQNFAFAGVVLTQLLPGLLFAPLGGMLADRFDRRKIMIVADIARFGLLISIAVVGTPLWLFIGNFLVGSAAMMWIPSKDAAVPNLLRRRDQVETANQLGMVMTYGVSVVTGAGLYAVLTGIQTTFNLPPSLLGEFGTAKIVVVLNGLLYLASALLVARIPELSLRNVHPMPEAKTGQVKREAEEQSGGLRSMVRDGVRFVRSTPLVRGLLIGMMGAFAAGGAVIGSAKPYSSSLGGGDAVGHRACDVGEADPVRLEKGAVTEPLGVARRQAREQGVSGLAVRGALHLALVRDADPSARALTHDVQRLSHLADGARDPRRIERRRRALRGEAPDRREFRAHGVLSQRSRRRRRR